MTSTAPTVRDVMSATRISLDARQPLNESVEEMKLHGLRTMAVTDADGSFKGVLLWREAEAALSRGSQNSLTAADVCRTGVAIGPDDPLPEAQALLEREQVGSLPVVDAGGVVGVVSKNLIATHRELMSQRGALEELRPPDDLLDRYRHTADSFFETGIAGVATLRHFGLQPGHHILDPGCGLGRLAVALTQYLSPEGRYEGFDVFREGIEWCSHAITPRYPNFRFTHADVMTTREAPDAETQSEDYTFPYGDEEFDFVVLISVFTHMLPEGFDRYLSEIARVLKQDGRVMASFFLLTDETLGQLDAGQNPQQPLHDFGDHRLADLKFPEDTVAYRESHVRSLFERLDLEMIELIRGDWATKDHPRLGRQDVIVARKGPEVDSPRT